jgi:hypothetical protein
MLNIKYNPKRTIEEGQYFVELANIDPTDEYHIDRVGYWCDLPHLRFAIIKPVLEVIEHIIEQ